MAHITTFADVKKMLEAYWPAHLNLSEHVHSLEHVERLMDFLGNPQQKFKVVHIAGTSGKTSTAHYTAALLQQAGYKVGLTISPHVDEINERVQVNLTPLPEKQFCEEFEQFMQLLKKSGLLPVYFDVIIFAFACWVYARQRIDYAVIEVGVGGLLDTTNVINGEDKVCVITDIGFDHMKLLGNTIPEIAAQKAGIIHLHNSVFCYRQSPDIMEAIETRARSKRADVYICRPPKVGTYSSLPLFQQRNLGLAVETVQWILQRNHAPALTDVMIAHAAGIRIPARMEAVNYKGRTVIMDVAHNPQKLHALHDSLRLRSPGQKVALLVSVLSQRESMLPQIAKELASLADHVIITTFSGPQDGPKHSANVAPFAADCREAGIVSHQVVADPEQALEVLLARPEPVLVVAGSFYLLNHIRPLLKGTKKQG